MAADNSPELRCSDADRDQVAAQLREHYAEGRLDLDEFQERTNAVYAAKTFGDLAPLTTDLPARSPQDAPREAEDDGGDRPGAGGSGRGRLVAMWTPWLSTSLICIGIWLISMLAGSDWIYPWPVWVVGPWGVVLLVATLGGAGSQRRHLERREERQQARRQRREWHDQMLEGRNLRISQDREYQEYRQHRDHRDHHRY